jgi:hypothetical protein
MTMNIDFWDLGRLIRADRWMFIDSGETDPNWLVAVEFVFEGGAIVVEAVPEDDTISVHSSAGALKHWSGASTRLAAAHPACGCGVRWAWSLTNHQGYADGFQIEFASDQPAPGFQFVTEASRLVEFTVERARERSFSSRPASSSLDAPPRSEARQARRR